MKSLIYYEPRRLEVAEPPKPNPPARVKNLSFSLVHAGGLGLCSSVSLTRSVAILYSPKTFKTTLYDNPVKDTNKIHLFLAENVIKIGKQKLDVTEDIEVVLIPVASVLDKIINGEICVAGTVAALFLGLNFLNQSRLQH